MINLAACRRSPARSHFAPSRCRLPTLLPPLTTSLHSFRRILAPALSPLAALCRHCILHLSAASLLAPRRLRYLLPRLARTAASPHTSASPHARYCRYVLPATFIYSRPLPRCSPRATSALLPISFEGGGRLPLLSTPHCLLPAALATAHLLAAPLLPSAACLLPSHLPLCYARAHLTTSLSPRAPLTVTRAMASAAS